MPAGDELFDPQLHSQLIRMMRTYNLKRSFFTKALLSNRYVYQSAKSFFATYLRWPALSASSCLFSYL